MLLEHADEPVGLERPLVGRAPALRRSGDTPAELVLARVCGNFS